MVGAASVTTGCCNCCVVGLGVGGDIRSVGDDPSIFVGRVVGRVVGPEEGRFVGRVVGRFDGRSVGNEPSLFVGRSVGRIDGRFVGDFVGDKPSLFVGRSVGRIDGRFVGDFVGDKPSLFVGRSVGRVDGRFVGDFVGDSVESSIFRSNFGRCVGFLDGSCVKIDGSNVEPSIVGSAVFLEDDFVGKLVLITGAGAESRLVAEPDAEPDAVSVGLDVLFDGCPIANVGRGVGRGDGRGVAFGGRDRVGSGTLFGSFVGDGVLFESQNDSSNHVEHKHSSISFFVLNLSLQ
jgi:uncharacterized protein YcfJ